MTQEYGDREKGQLLVLGFPTRKTDGELTSLFQSAAGGTPTFELRNRATGVAIANNPPTININVRSGWHHMVWNSDLSTDAAINTEYDLVCTDGRVSADGTLDNWRSVTNDVALCFNLQNGSAGFVLQRSLKMAAFTVELVLDHSNFEISGPHIVQAPNFYALLNIAFDPGAANFSRGGVVRTSGAATGGNTAIELMTPLPVLPQPGDTGSLMPEERPAEQYWADIRGEFAPTDKYSAEWFNGAKSIAPDSAPPTITIQRLSNATYVATDQPMTAVAGGNVFRYESTNELIAPNDKAHVTVSAVINGTTRTFSRTLVYAT